jgi:hypothetical protein
MSYCIRWWRKALSDTRAHWTAPRVATTVIAPVVTGVLWTIYREWGGWSALLQIALISVLGFLALWWVVLVVTITLAPSRLDAETRSTHALQISALQEEIERGKDALAGAVRKSKALEEELSRKHPHDAHLETQVVEALQKLNEHERRFVRWLLDSGRIPSGRVQTAGFHGLQEQLNQRAGIDLITHEIERAANGMEIDRSHEINPSYLLALKNVLHPPRPNAPPPA